MGDKLNKEPKLKGLLPTADLPLEPSQEVTVEYHHEAPKGKKGKQIHPRRDAPPITEGPDVPDLSPSPPVDIT